MIVVLGGVIGILMGGMLSSVRQIGNLAVH